MKKYRIFFDGQTAKVEVADRHRGYVLTWLDDSQPTRPFANPIFPHMGELSWALLGAALLRDAGILAEDHQQCATALGHHLGELGGEASAVTEAELAAFVCGWGWRIVYDESARAHDVNDPPMTEGGI